jgi:glycosyltransferase involved in cell wall biosynthesis
MKPAVLVTAPSQGGYGGIETFVLSLSEALRTTGAVKVRLVFKLVKGFTLSNALGGAVKERAGWCRIVRRASLPLAWEIHQSDIVHAQNASPDTVLFAWLMRRPLLLTIHNRLEGRPSLRRRMWRCAARLANRRWYNSGFVAQSWGSAQPDSDVVFTAMQVKFGFADLAPRRGFFFIGRWIENKGADTLIEAYRQARIDRARFPLEMAGSGPLLKPLSDRVRALGIEGVRLHGFVDEARKESLYRHAAWLVAPPNTLEDMGVTPMEARGKGIPCIVTRDGGLPEAAGSDALVCPPNDPAALARCLEAAAAMEGQEYERRARSTFEELKRQIVDAGFYVNEYVRVLGQASVI